MEHLGRLLHQCKRFAVLVELDDEPRRCVICARPRAAHPLEGLRLLTSAEALTEREDGKLSQQRNLES